MHCAIMKELHSSAQICSNRTLKIMFQKVLKTLETESAKQIYLFFSQIKLLTVVIVSRY